MLSLVAFFGDSVSSTNTKVNVKDSFGLFYTNSLFKTLFDVIFQSEMLVSCFDSRIDVSVLRAYEIRSNVTSNILLPGIIH